MRVWVTQLLTVIDASLFQNVVQTHLDVHSAAILSAAPDAPEPARQCTAASDLFENAALLRSSSTALSKDLPVHQSKMYGEEAMCFTCPNGHD